MTNIRSVADVIQRLIDGREYKRYLEIGVDDGGTFRSIEAPTKLGVDPATDVGGSQMTSDAFFAQNYETWDVALVDGDHRWMAALRDIGNALEWVQNTGIVVVHDILPTCEEHSQLRYDASPSWRVPGNGSVWKAWAILRMSRPDLNMRALALGDGFGLITHRLVSESCKLFRPTDTGSCPSLDGPDWELTWDFYRDNYDELFLPMSVEDFDAGAWKELF